MRNSRLVLLVGLFIALASSASAGPFYAVTNQLGYQGTVWNITDGSDPVATHTPRNADLYLTQQAPQVYSDYNQLLSSWFSHSVSNQNDSFIQLSVDGQESPWTATGDWDADLKVFSLSVVSDGVTPYPYSRFWQPDRGDAWGVSFLGYQYNFVATFAAPATVVDGWYVSTGSPLSITGNFSGRFQRTQDTWGGPLVTGGDIYGFSINFDSAWSTPPDRMYTQVDGRWVYQPCSGDACPDAPYSEFGTPVPEPATLTLLGLGLAGVARAARRRKK